MVHYTGVIFYAIFASGEKQAWADPESTSEDKSGLVDQDELAEETELTSDTGLTAAKKVSYGTTTENASNRRQGWRGKRGATVQEEEASNHQENGSF